MAQEFYDKADVVYQKFFTGNHYAFASIIYGKAKIFEELKGDLKSALTLYEETLEILIKAYGETHPTVARTYMKLGEVNLKLGDSKKCLKFLEKASQIIHDCLQQNHPYFAVLSANMGKYFANQGDMQKALEYFDNALKIFKIVYGESHPEMELVSKEKSNICELLGLPTQTNQSALQISKTE